MEAIQKLHYLHGKRKEEEEEEEEDEEDEEEEEFHLRLSYGHDVEFNNMCLEWVSSPWKNDIGNYHDQEAHRCDGSNQRHGGQQGPGCTAESTRVLAPCAQQPTRQKSRVPSKAGRFRDWTFQRFCDREVQEN
jgi:hypothetical protein